MSRNESGTAVAGDLEAEARAALQEAEGKVCFESLKALRAVHSWLLALHSEAEDDHVVRTGQILDDQERFLTLGAATGAVLDDKQDRWENQSLLDYWYTVLYRAGRRPPKPRLAPLDETLLPNLDDKICPYLGLDAFREEHSRLFFGRQRLLEALLAKFKEEPLLAVVGASGSGKSSVVWAGLIPALRSGSLSDSASWTILPPMVPGSDPLDSLVRLVLHHQADPLTAPVPAPPADEPVVWLAKELREDPHCLAALLDRPGDLPVVVVDQFEEVFTLCDDPKATEAFIDNLVELVRTDAGTPPKNRIILIMRSDFEVYVLRYLKLRRLFDAGRVAVTPMEREELREAIERPAQQVGLVFEKGVVDALLEDAYGEPGALPLLQFALLKLWENRWRNKVTMEACRRLGGCREALRTTADMLYRGMSYENQQAAKRIFLRIVRPSEGLEVTNKRVPLRDLLPPGEDHTRTRVILTQLVEARLVRLTPGQREEDTQVEVAHEALVRNWPQLVDWLSEQRAAIVARQRLESKVAEWVRWGRGRIALLDVAQLHEAQRWLNSVDEVELGVIPDLQALIEASQKALADERQLKEETVKRGRDRDLAIARQLGLGPVKQ